MKRVAILGSTGSVGHQALNVIRAQPAAFTVVGLAAGRNLALLRDQAQEFRPEAVAITHAPPPGQNGSALTALQSGSPDGTRVYAGADSLFDLTLSTKPDIVVAATTGLVGLAAILAALEAGIDVALANKESLIAASDLLFAAANQSGAAILPVDSEHSAIFQCLVGEDRSRVTRVILTASGGPFRTLPAAAMAKITPEQALAHPTWQMGPKITIDSATLMNKGMEVLEAGILFFRPQAHSTERARKELGAGTGRTLDYVDVVIHPQSIVHSLVEFSDGSVKAQLGYPDMELPIQYALGYPQRLASDFRPLDLAALGQLTFEAPDPVRFPCLALAREAGLLGGTAPAVLCAADEVAVRWFLDGRLPFTDIPTVIAAVLHEHPPQAVESVEQLLAVERWALRQADQCARRLAQRADRVPVGARTR